MAISYTAPRIELEDLAKEVEELNYDSQEQRRSDFYGDYEDIVETTELLASSINRLKHVLLELSAEAATTVKVNQAFLRAQQECPDYVFSDDVLLPFLRSERFHVPRTASRILEYWESKVRLFPKNAFCPITLDTLQEGDLNVLRNGGYAMLDKDQHGRIVFHGRRDCLHLKQNGREAAERALLYLMHVAIEDVSVQRRGMVFLSGCRSPFNPDQFDRSVFKNIFRLFSYGPIRNVAFHAVTGFLYASISEIVLPAACWLMGYDLRMRLKLHRDDGADLGTVFAAYGITKLPLCIGGRFEVDGDAWLCERQRIESEAATSL